MLPNLLIAVILILAGILIQALREQDKLRKSLHRYDSLASREERERQLDSSFHRKQSELIELESQKESLNSQIKKLQQKLNELDAKLYLESVDSYEEKYDFIRASDYLIQLKNIIEKQENLRKQNKAFVSEAQVTVDGNKKQGEQMIRNLLKLIKIAFETECNYAIKEMKSNNVSRQEKKINNIFNKLNQLSALTKCKISQEYLDLKLKELHLKHELEEIEKEEREREKEISDQMKREEKERRAIEKARQEAEEAEQREMQYQEELEKMRRQLEQSVGIQQEETKRCIQQLEAQLAEAKSDKEKKNLYIQKLKSGTIYVISNIGSFGKDVYRIGMTKRGVPDEYIRDFNRAVPFPFDVHAKITSDDASDTERRIHQRLYARRVNKVNKFKREFFRVSLDEIAQAIEEIAEETDAIKNIRFEKVPSAYEYRKTLALEQKTDECSSVDNSYPEDEMA